MAGFHSPARSLTRGHPGAGIAAAGTIVAAAAVLGTVVAVANRGFDLTDEAYYVLDAGAGGIPDDLDAVRLRPPPDPCAPRRLRHGFAHFRPRGARRLWSRGGGLVPELAPSARRGAPGALPCRGRCRRSSPAGNVLRLLAADTVLQPPRAGGGAPASARDRAPRRPRTRSIAPCRSRGACRPDRRDGEAACGGRLCGAVPRGDGPAAARAAADRCPARVLLWLHGGRGRRVGGPAAVGDRLGADAGLYRDARRGCAGRTGSDCRPPGVSRPPARLAVRGGPDRGGPRREGRAVRAGASGRARASPGWRLPR